MERPSSQGGPQLIGKLIESYGEGFKDLSEPERFQKLTKDLTRIVVDWKATGKIAHSVGNVCAEVAKTAKDTTQAIQFSKVGEQLTQYADHVAETLKPAEQLVAATEGGVKVPTISAREYEKGAKIPWGGMSAAEAAKIAAEGANGAEVFLPKVKTFEQARNLALEIIGDMGADAEPHFGRLKTSKGLGQVIGRISSDKKVRWYLDYDPIKGMHVNIHDFRLGKRCTTQKFVIPFEGTEDTFVSLLKHLNR